MMDAKMKGTGIGRPLPAGIALGWCTALTVTLLGSLFLTWLVLSGTLDWKNLGYGILIMLLVASYAGAATAAEKANQKRVVACALAGAAYLITLFGITALFFDGKYETIGITAVVIAGGSACALLVHSAEKKGRRRSSRKRRL